MNNDTLTKGQIIAVLNEAQPVIEAFMRGVLCENEYRDEIAPKAAQAIRTMYEARLNRIEGMKS